jgi:PAS domain-containing protein
MTRDHERVAREVKDFRRSLAGRLNAFSSEGFPRVECGPLAEEPCDEVRVELAPGLIVPFELDPLGTGVALPERLEGTAALIAAQVWDVLPLAEAIRTHLANARRYLRRSLTAWKAAGGHDLVRLEPTPPGTWLGTGPMTVWVTLTELGRNLRPVGSVLSLGADGSGPNPYYCAGNDAEIARMASLTATRAALRAELARLGADGRTDGVSTAVLAAFGLDPPEALALALDHEELDLREGLRLCWSEGRLYADFRLEGLHGCGPDIWIDDASAPETVLRGLIGRPVTDAIRHAFLRPDWTIASCGSLEDEDHHSFGLWFRLQVPQLLFNAASREIRPE